MNNFAPHPYVGEATSEVTVAGGPDENDHPVRMIVLIRATGTFAGTENYKTHGDPKWVEILDDDLA